MHHINELHQYKLYKDIEDKSLLYKEINNLLENGINFKNYKKFYNDYLRSIENDNVKTIEKQLIEFVEN